METDLCQGLTIVMIWVRIFGQWLKALGSPRSAPKNWVKKQVGLWTLTPL